MTNTLENLMSTNFMDIILTYSRGYFSSFVVKFSTDIGSFAVDCLKQKQRLQSVSYRQDEEWRKSAGDHVRGAAMTLEFRSLTHQEAKH